MPNGSKSFIILKMNNFKIKNRLCPICSYNKKNLIFEQKFCENKEIALLNRYDVVVCKNCGFVYADKIPSQDDFNIYYKKISKYEFSYRKGIVPNNYINHFTKIVNFLIPYISDKNIKILDIGCSTGALLSVFKSYGYFNLLGLDPSPICSKIAKKLYNIKVISNNISNFRTREKFDLIILSAVLEHLVDIKSSVRKIRRLLKEGGFLFIEVPDIERFDLYISAPFQQFSLEHINYFSRYSIKNLLSKFSFKIIKIEQKENKINKNVEPDLFVLAKKKNKFEHNLIKDKISEIKIKKYIPKCLKIEIETQKKIHKKLFNKEKIIVWGAGTFTQRLVACGGLEPAKVLFFVDSNKRYINKKLSGIEIKSPSDIKNEKIPILISTPSYQEEIVYQIRKLLKLNNEIIKIF